MNSRCAICSEDDVEAGHEETRKHMKNVLLDQLSKNQKNFTENTDGLAVLCTICPTAYNAEPLLVDSPQHILKASIQPRAEVKFSFNIRNDNDHDIVLDGVTMLPTNIVNFNMVNNNMGQGTVSRLLRSKSNFGETVEITFENPVVGVYKMPVFFFFSNEHTEETTIIIKEMIVFVEAVQKTHEKVVSPYTGENIYAEKVVPSTAKRPNNYIYDIPSKDHKIVFSRDLKTDVEGATDEQKALAEKIKEIFESGPTQENYRDFFHNLLWFEETVIANNLKNYNMTAVTLFPRGRLEKSYALRVPGLAEKRPSLMIGDLAHVRPNGQTLVLFEAVITQIEDNFATFAGLNQEFKDYYDERAKFDVRFFMSRLPLERMHVAAHAQPQHAAERAFPRAVEVPPPVTPVTRYYNQLVARNPEQRAVVSHILAGSSGTAPYLLYGPPGTGKTVTIVEAILQLASNPKNQILVCTDSNKAADHVASMLVQYTGSFANEQFILRANSEFRIWESFPASLAPYSNGTNRGSWYRVSIHKFRSHRIVITTLIHAAKFACELKKKKYKVQRVTTHVFVDEAAQASEPATLVPVCGLLAPAGQLVLAGDPMQLGPVVISREASKLGLGVSLMERLKNKCPLYANANPNYIMMLKKNFRSHADILSIPDQLFYNNQLEALAPFDPISQRDILGNDAKSRAIVFHGVLSKEQRIGKSPSFYNSMELEIVQSYITALVENHKVAQQDIGVVAPYIRQVYKIKNWLIEQEWGDIEVGTVEAFQGKEKRVVLVSTVRANCDLFAHDAKFRLGFVVDAKRFNVALTRAKAKLIVIGNPLCLKKDTKWTSYMQKCRDFGTYTGFDCGPLVQEDNEDAIFDQLTPILRAMTRALANIRL